MVRTDDDRLWFRRFSEAPDAAVRLICLPHAGGAASYFVPVARALAPEIEVLAVQPPGRQDRRHEPCAETIPDLAEAVAARLRDWADKPMALFGHSMGAIVAFETTRRLIADDIRPVALFVSGRVAASTHRDERTHLLDDAALTDHIRRLGGTDDRILADPEMVTAILAAARADYRAISAYRCLPGPPLPTPIHAYLGDSDSQVTPTQAEAWERHTTGGFDLRVFPGGHFYLEQHAAQVVRSIGESVGRALRERGSNSSSTPG
ncbi:thioesterase II family protein [Nocardia bovistercoris]|uniref:Thioesterase TesA n=1 Tax=Nocardia bovistercoris TaxID=2785916 RepID=A0A931IK37_9NOCA|nr:alpha/beta fold hydrolase [Nocardia bovistercoris]MBH0781008.1 thioesterase [Nocardia bovistercoris]